ncbi:MAG TPA: GntR family transcriptional regulator [Capsulimonadaceae bacterium]|nr:GntR family transcriptional regulator [Capsulimonadaceae bacterium]
MLSHTLIDKESALPRHAQIESHFRGLIASGRLAPGERIPPETDIADTLGVSRMTVNKALLALTRAGLFVRERGVGTFVAHAPAPLTMRLNVSVPLDLSVETDQHDYYYAPLYRAMHAEADILHHHISMAYLPHGGYLEHQRKKQAEGWLLISPDERHLPSLLSLLDASIPAVIVGACWPDIAKFSTVDSDNIAGANEVVRYLRGLGHERIAFLYAGPEASNTQDRRMGYRLALKQGGLSLKADWEIRAESAERLGNAADHLRELLAKPLSQRPTAVFAAGYYLALGTLGLAEEIGLAVPSALSVVGYDDPFAAQLVRPSLTTVRQPLSEMGRAAVVELDRQLRKEAAGPCCLRFAPTLHVRGSASRPPVSSSKANRTARRGTGLGKAPSSRSAQSAGKLQ